MNGLKLNHDRDTLKRILENSVPQTLQDVVIIYAAVNGLQDGELREENYVNKVYPGSRGRSPLVGDSDYNGCRYLRGTRPGPVGARQVFRASSHRSTSACPIFSITALGSTTPMAATT